MHSTPSVFALATTMSMNDNAPLRPAFGWRSDLRYDRSTALPVACTLNVPACPFWSRMPQLPLFHNAPFDAASACFIHSFIPARGPADGPSVLPVYGRVFGLVVCATSECLIVFVYPAQQRGDYCCDGAFGIVAWVGRACRVNSNECAYK